jgi:hypothetical protein
LTLVGLVPLGEDIPFNAFQLIGGKSINGTYFGGIVKRIYLVFLYKLGMEHTIFKMPWLIRLEKPRPSSKISGRLPVKTADGRRAYHPHPSDRIHQ